MKFKSSLQVHLLGLTLLYFLIKEQHWLMTIDFLPFLVYKASLSIKEFKLSLELKRNLKHNCQDLNLKQSNYQTQ